MPIIKVTAADIAKTKNLEPGWYQAQVIKVHPLEKSSEGGSINQKIDFLIENANGKEITCTFNSKLMGKIAPLVETATGTIFQPGEFDTDLLQGKKVDVKVQPNLYNGNLIDKIVLFLPYGKSKDVAPF